MEQLLPRLVEHAQVQCPGMQIDAAVECVLLLIETHGSPWHGSGAGARIVVGRYGLPENPTWATASAASLLPLGQAPAHPTEAMKIIQPLHLTAAALPVILASTCTCRRGR